MYKDEAMNALYRADSIEKHFIAEFRKDGTSIPFLTVYDGKRFYDMTMEESLSSEENLNFGSCEATQIKITVIDLDEPIKNTEMTLYQVLDGVYPADDLFPGNDVYPSGHVMPFGKYVIQSADRQPNTRYRIVTALDFMCKFDVDVTNWYNALPFPLTLRDFRARLCQHIGVTEYVPADLPNDGMLVEKTIDTAQLMGRDVLIACEQINGAFGHFDRNGVLQHVVLQPNYTLMPAPDLYPSADLFPMLPGTMNEQVYDEKIDPYLMISCQYEEYTVKSIDKVQIRQEEGDIGAIYGAGTNCLTIEGNFLVFGKAAAELNVIAQGIYGMVNGRPYVPFECKLKGLPYLEVGDTGLLEFGGSSITTYIIKRTLKGIFALKDTYSATGEEIRGTTNNINTDIIQLKGKSAIIKKSVEEVSVKLTDLEKNTEAQLKVVADSITAEVKRAKESEASISLKADSIVSSVSSLREDMNSQFKQTASAIDLKVTKGNVCTQITAESANGGQIILRAPGALIIDAGNTTLNAQGVMTLRGATFDGCINTGTMGADTIHCNSIDISLNAVVDGQVQSSSVYCGGDGSFNEIYIRNGWWDGWSVTQEVQGLHNAVFGGSDRRIKKEIKNISEKSVEFILKSRPVSFLYRENNQPSLGFIAQEILKLQEELGTEFPIVDTDPHTGMYYVKYLQYIPLLVAAVQDLQNQIKENK